MSKNFNLFGVGRSFQLGRIGSFLSYNPAALPSARLEILSNDGVSPGRVAAAPAQASSELVTLSQVSTWQTASVVAVAATYFDIEDYGEIPDSGTTYFSFMVGAQQLSGGVVRSGLVFVEGYVIRQPAAAPSVPSQSVVQKGSATLPGWSTGPRVTTSGNNLILQGRVTNAGLCDYTWFGTPSSTS